MKLRIGTWNISEGIQAEWSLSEGLKEGDSYKETDLIKQIIQKINEFQFDILCFQEFPVEIDGKESLKEKIYNETDLKYSVMLGTYDSFLFKGGVTGVSIFSKYPITYEEKTYFNNPNLTKVSKTGETYTSYDKGIVLAKIKVQNEEITVINGHAIAFRPFGKTSDDYPESYKPLEEIICNNCINNNKVIVCGDFNNMHVFELIPEIKGKVTDLINKDTTIDYIMITSNIIPGGIKAIENLSDHDLFVANIEI